MIANTYIDLTALGIPPSSLIKHAVTNPNGLRRWRAALANAYYSPASIVAMGDSITNGVGSDGSSSSTVGGNATYIWRGWAGILRQLFAQTYGYPGEGFMRANDLGGRVVWAGGAVLNQSTGSYEQASRLNGAGQTATYTLPVCDQIDFYTWDGGSGTVSYQIDGGASVNFSAGSNNSSALTWTKTSITGLMPDAHTIQFNGAAGCTLYVSAVAALKSVTCPDGVSRIAGVQVHRNAVAGNTTANLVGLDSALNGNSAGQTRMITAAAKTLGASQNTGPDLIIIPLGVNDYQQQNNLSPTQVQPGTTPTTYAQNLRTFITTVLAASSNTCILLVGEPRSYAPPSPETYAEAQYYAQAKAIAASTDHVAFLDVGALWGAWTAGNAYGLYTTNSVHPSQKGHADMARIIYNALTLNSIQ